MLRAPFGRQYLSEAPHCRVREVAGAGDPAAARVPRLDLRAGELPGTPDVEEDRAPGLEDGEDILLRGALREDGSRRRDEGLDRRCRRLGGTRDEEARGERSLQRGEASGHYGGVREAERLEDEPGRARGHR